MLSIVIRLEVDYLACLCIWFRIFILTSYPPHVSVLVTVAWHTLSCVMRILILTRRSFHVFDDTRYMIAQPQLDRSVCCAWALALSL